MLRKIVIVVVFLMVAYMIRVLAGHYYAAERKPAAPAAQQDNSQQEIANAVAALNGRLPMTVLDGALRIESVHMKERVLHVFAQQVNKPAEGNRDKENFAHYAKQAYCKGPLLGFSGAAIPVQYNFQSPPQSLDDLRVDTWTVLMQPADCT